MKKRILSILLCLVMVLGLLPAAAFAAGTTVEVDSYDELKEAMERDSMTYVKLTADIDTTSLNNEFAMGPKDVIEVKGDITLDLDGKMLTLNTTSPDVNYFIHVDTGSSLTIKNSKDSYSSYIRMKHSGVAGFYGILVDGNLTVDSGEIKCNDETYKNYSYLIYNKSGTVTINNGSRITNRNGRTGIEKLSELSHALYDGRDSKAVTINGGTFEGLVTLWANKLESGTVKKVINGGTFKDSVALNGTDLENAESPLDVAINSGTFCTKYRAASMDFYCYFQQFGVPEGTWTQNHKRKGYIDAKAFASIFPDDATILLHAYEYTGSNYGRVEVSSGPARMLSGSDDAEDLKNLVCESIYPVITIYRGGLSNLTLKTGDTTITESNGFGSGSIAPDNDSKTITFTATAPSGLRDLVKGKEADYAASVWLSKKASGDDAYTDLTSENYTLTVDNENGHPKVTLTLKEKPNEGDVYTVFLFLNAKVQLNAKAEDGGDTLTVLHDTSYWTLTTELPKTLTGTVHYTSSAVCGKPISTSVTDLPTVLTSDGLTRQWQRSTDNGSSWTDISGATENTYIPTAKDMGENVRLRVRMTADGWFGELVSAPVKVSKAANNADPGIPMLTAGKAAGSADYTQFTITDFDSKQEYVYTESPVDGWPNTGVTGITHNTVTGLEKGKTYYVYARYKATDEKETGTVVRRSSVLLDDVTKLNRLVLSDSEGNAYTDYGTGNTIYVKKGESVTLNVSKDPTNATKWSAYTFGPDSGSTTKYDVTTPTNGSVTENQAITSITIEGKESGKETLVAKYSGSVPQYYGRWYVVVYEDISNIDFGNITITNKPSFPNVTMYKGETAAVPTYDTLTTSPANALNDYTFEWRVMKPAAGAGSQPTYVTDNGYLKVVDNKNITALQNTPEATNQYYKTVALCAVKGTSAYEIASYLVTVTDAPEITLTGLTVSPAKAYLDTTTNKTVKLTAAKTPVNAAGTLSWSSSDTSVATVSNDGLVTAVAEGTATITVSCGGAIKATCTVLVGHEHDTDTQTWQKLDEFQHYRTCTSGDDWKTENHTVTAWMANSDNKTHTGTCTACSGPVTVSHTWVYDDTSSKPATVTEEGKDVYTCFCGATKTETIAKLIPSGSGGGGVSAYTVTVKDSQHGTVTADRKTAASGTTVTLTVKPEQGWTLETLTAADASGKELDLTIAKAGETYSFKMPSGNVTVTATFMEDNTILNYFVDVPTDAYYYEAVLWAVEQGITKGTDSLHFSPDGICTRAQAVTFLWHAAGSPAPKTTTMPFTDVKSGVYYYDAVLWAAENGIIKGTSATAFSPNENSSRAQIATLLWRSEKSPAAGTVNPFTDVKSDAYYADAVLWAVKENITKGTTSTTFSPDANCTRAQMVTFIYRCMK